MTYPDGGKYQGKWTNGKRQPHYQGTLTYANGATYKGQFKGMQPMDREFTYEI